MNLETMPSIQINFIPKFNFRDQSLNLTTQKIINLEEKVSHQPCFFYQHKT